MMVVSHIAFIPPAVIVLINSGLEGNDVSSILQTFAAEKVSAAFMVVCGVLGIVASIFIWKYIILGFRFMASGEILNGSGGSGSSSGSGNTEAYYGQKSADANYEYYKKQSEKMTADQIKKSWEQLGE